MRVGVVAVGSELLAGIITNGNGAWLGRRFTEAGLEVSRSVAVGDDVGEIARTVGEELTRADAVVLTGGLGPTSDDRTREALAAVGGSPLRRDPGLEARLRQWYADRGRALPAQAAQQADVPEGAHVLDNPNGSAVGLRVEVAGGVVYALPGVPREMTAMVGASVLPDLLGRAGLAGASTPAWTLRTAVAGETEVSSLLAPLERELSGGGLVDVAYLASVGEVQVRLTARAGTEGTAVDAAADEARRLLGDLVYGEGQDSLDVAVHRLLAGRAATVAVAESLTGGLLGAALTDMPGSSGTFRGGVTAYATELKSALLGVDAGLLARHGPVHPEVAGQMALGARERLDATFGVATTGVAGPDTQGAPVGTVHVAVAGPDAPVVWTGRGTGGRDVVRRRCVVAALDLLRRVLSGRPPYGE